MSDLSPECAPKRTSADQVELIGWRPSDNNQSADCFAAAGCAPGSPAGKSVIRCPVLFAKIFRFSFDPNHFYIYRRPGPHRGAFRDRHERREGMRWTRQAQIDERR